MSTKLPARRRLLVWQNMLIVADSGEGVGMVCEAVVQPTQGERCGNVRNGHCVVMGDRVIIYGCDSANRASPGACNMRSFAASILRMFSLSQLKSALCCYCVHQVLPSMAFTALRRHSIVTPRRRRIRLRKTKCQHVNSTAAVLVVLT